MANDVTKLLLIGHKLNHPFGSHMHLHKCKLLAKCLNQNPGVRATVSNGWPSDENLLKNIYALVLYSSPAAGIFLNPKNKPIGGSIKSGVGYTAMQ
ncbi:MAG: hypothetical protein CMO52_09205 [Verrucomicrobiales bacterium]|nr:hypothetical protein [Verrucomicrobiales bacterium]